MGVSGAPPGEGPLGVVAHDWVASDVGYVKETDAERHEREQRQLQLLLNLEVPPTLPGLLQQQQKQQQQQLMQQQGSRGTALFIVSSVEDLFVANLEESTSRVPGMAGPLDGDFSPPLESFHGIPVLFLDGPQGTDLLLRLPAYERWR